MKNPKIVVTDNRQEYYDKRIEYKLDKIFDNHFGLMCDIIYSK